MATLPGVVAEGDRNQREAIRITLDHFGGRNIIDIRSWWRDSGGELKSGRTGIALAVRHLPTLKLTNGLTAALAQAHALGPIEAQSAD